MKGAATVMPAKAMAENRRMPPNPRGNSRSTQCQTDDRAKSPSATIRSMQIAAKVIGVGMPEKTESGFEYKAPGTENVTRIKMLKARAYAPYCSGAIQRASKIPSRKFEPEKRP